MSIIDPKLIEFATVRQIEYIDAIEKYGGIVAAAKQLKVSHQVVSKSMSVLKKFAASRGYSPRHDMTRIVPDGFNVKGVSTYYNKDGEKSGQWIKSQIDQDRQREIMEAAFNAMAAELPKSKPVAAPGISNDALCNLVVFSDYHMGMLAWHKEGGADWDLRIAEKLLFDSFEYIIKSAPNASKLVLCLNGDQLHTDGLIPQTSTHHHVLDADSRYPKIIDATIRVIRKIVRAGLEKHKSLHLVIVQGNHDEMGSIWLKRMFAALYEEEPRITVDDSELPFHVHQHGQVMLAFHHGHKVSNEQLPLLFASQYAKVWGDTLKRYCHTGHRHHVDEKEYAGMTVTQHPTLAARDAYASRGGWISERAAVAVTYHEKFGQVSRTIACPEMFE